MAMSKKTRALMGDRVGAPFAAWRIKPDFSVVGVTLYTCNDPTRHVSARQAYTARGQWLAIDRANGEVFTNQLQALSAAHSRAAVAMSAARSAYVKATERAIASRNALRAHLPLTPDAP